MKTRFMKCALALIIVLSMVFTPWSLAGSQLATAFADEAVTVSINAQYKQEFLAIADEVKVYPGLAEEYGYKNAETVPEGVITALDALVAAHVKKYGEAIGDYLKMNDYGNPVEFFGNKNTDKFSGFAINHSFPMDENSTGYSVFDAPVSDGDIIDFFYYEDEYYGDYLTWFADESGQAVEEITVEKDSEVSLYLKGFMYMAGYASPAPEAVYESDNALTAYKADQEGAITETIGDVTDETGKVVIPTDEAGTFFITAQGYNEDGFLIVMPACKVTVKEEESEGTGQPGEEDPEDPSQPGEEDPEDPSQPGEEEPGQPAEEEPEPGNPAPLTEVPAQWKNFRNSDSNMAVVSQPLATTQEEAILKWKAVGSSLSNWGFYYPTTYIIVNDKIVATGGNQIFLIDRETGNVEKQVTLYGNKEYSYMPPVYGGGMIYVAQNKGIIQAFDAVTLESKWIYEDAVGGQSLSNIAYKDGFIYTGFTGVDPTKENNFVAIDVRDKAPEKQDERKKPYWTYSHQGGFYWSGAVVLDKYVVVGGENSTLLVLDKETGKLADTVEVDGDIRSSIAEQDGKLYCVTKGGSFYQFTVNQGTGKVENFVTVAKLEAGSTSTPVIAKGKAYMSLYNKTVAHVDLETGKIQTVEVPAMSQSSLLANTFYEGKTYLYLVCNNVPGSLDLIEVNDETGAMEYRTVYVPEEALQNYSIASVMCDERGVMYYSNDSGHIFAIDNKEKGAEVDPGEEEPGKPGEADPEKPGTDPEKPTETKEDTIPDTGDDNILWTWIIIFGLATTGLCTSKAYKRQRKG